MHAMASMIRAARLRQGAWMALARVVEHTGCLLASELQIALGLSYAEVRTARNRLVQLRTWGPVKAPPWRARWLARTVGDDISDVSCGLGAAVMGSLLAYARKRGHRKLKNAEREDKPR